MPKAKSRQCTKQIDFDDNKIAKELFGTAERNLNALAHVLQIDIMTRGNEVTLQGKAKQVSSAEQALLQIYKLLKKGYPLIDSDIEHALKLLANDTHVDLEDMFSDTIFLPARKKVIVPRTPSQRKYIDEMNKNDVVFAIGPAGTGKTYLAVAVAVSLLAQKKFKRLVISRPAVEAGERLGFLPGDMQEKINPYLRPVYDALYEMLGYDKVEEMIEDKIIEIAPLAFMRGRTLHSSFIILDEAQNSSYHQTKMCLTRLGVDSKLVVTGDVTQVDLPSEQRSGMLDAWQILNGLPGIAFHKFTEVDVVRHPLVAEIVLAYDKHEAKND